MNRTYELKNFQVKNENKQFPSGTGNPFSISLTSQSTITHLENADVSPLKFDFDKFTKIDALESLADNSKCGNYFLFLV